MDSMNFFCIKVGCNPINKLRLSLSLSELKGVSEGWNWSLLIKGGRSPVDKSLAELLFVKVINIILS